MKIINDIPVRRAAIGLCLALSCALPTSASASFADGVAPEPVNAATTDVGASPALAAADAFGILRQPAAKSIPTALTSLSASGDQLRAMGVDLAQTRSVNAGDRVFYVVPGSKAMCIFGPDGGGACARDLDAVRKHGMAVTYRPPQEGNWWEVARTGVGDQPKATVTYGLAPDGVRSVSIPTLSGRAAAAQMNGNAWVVESVEPAGPAQFD